ncbi:MAG: site-specific integrase [Clostridiales bacterium]|jgi:site-specific recombinase XerD|nr:site-specific integrase [Clostridiales bacterium]
MIETNALEQIYTALIAHLDEQNYSKQTLYEYQRTYQRLYLYLSEKQINCFSKEIGFMFIDDYYVSGNKSISRRYHVNLQRRISVLFEFFTEGAVHTRQFCKEPQQFSYFEDVFNLYVEYQKERGLTAKTIYSKSLFIRRFLLNLEDQQISSLLNIEVADVYQYLLTKKEYAVSSREEMLYTLRDALRFFVTSGLCKKELGDIFPQISTHPESPVPTCFSADEIKKIISSIDRKSKIGKRDYAVILLAALLGIRAGDIRNLRLSTIKWASENIEFTQSKTGRFLQLPLLPEIKFALLDYMKESRPNVESDYIFLKHRAPYTPLSEANSFHHVLQKYLGGVNIKNRKRGLHALRFSAAGNMLSNGTPITTICNVLGHTYSDTTKRYLKIDIDNLRKAALEVD